jgi:hypothetical protein
MRTAVILAFALATGSAHADEPKVAPAIEAPVSSGQQAVVDPPAAEPKASPPSGALVTFDRPQVWPDSLEETWRLVDREGQVICELPCSAPVPHASGYVLEGVGIFASGSWDVATGEPARRVAGPLRLPLPERIDVGPAIYARLHRVADPGTRVWARVHPGKGSPTGAIALGIVSGVALVFGLAVAVVGVVAPCSGDGCAGKAFFILPGLGLSGIGLVGGIGALAWGASSARPGIDFNPDRPTAPSASNAARLRVTLSPAGLAGTF